ncbi:MAG: sensor histidine kinase [Longimicrobiales bacterium]
MPSLKTSLLVGFALALLIALVPAGAWLDHRVGRELEDQARADLALAPVRLADRSAARGDALMMHAKELSSTGALANAFLRSPQEAVAVLQSMQLPPGETGILLDLNGKALLGPAPGAALFKIAAEGGMPVDYVAHRGRIYHAALAPVVRDNRIIAIAGVALPFDAAAASTLAGLTAAQVILVLSNGEIATSTVPDSIAAALLRVASDAAGEQRLGKAGNEEWCTVAAPLGSAGRVVFAFSLTQQLAILPQLRRVGLAAGVVALTLALLLAALATVAISHSVANLAAAADQVAAGRFDTSLPRPRLREIARMNRAFEHMRATLAARLDELHGANAELRAERERLQALQAELIQRDRLTAAGRLVTELAHEIRNPVANIRNCLEVIRRGAKDRMEVVRFADLAIDELLRMHELAEQMLDLNRPIDPAASRCDAGDIVLRTAEVLQAGEAALRWPTTVVAAEDVVVSIAPDVLKQVLLSLVQNAREAMPNGGNITIAMHDDRRTLTIDVLDDGPGIANEVLTRIFDPFVTTKSGVQGVGLGLFIAEGLVRRYGGRLTASNLDSAGARFRIELPISTRAAVAQSDTWRSGRGST